MRPQVWDLMHPQTTALPLDFNPVLGPGSSKLSKHVATNLRDFLSLVAGAISVKASLTLRNDMFLRCAHLCIRCKCSFQTSLEAPSTSGGLITFFEFGSKILEYAHDDKVLRIASRGFTPSVRIGICPEKYLEQRYHYPTCRSTPCRILQ